MQSSFNKLIPKVRESFSKQVNFDSGTPRGPIQEFRYWQTIHACAACAKILENSAVPFFRDLADGFAEFGKQSLLSNVSREDIVLASRQVDENITSLQAEARESCLEKIMEAELPEKLHHIRMLALLGEHGLAEIALDGVVGVDEKSTFSTSQLLLRSRALWREADNKARKLFSSDPDFVVQSGEPPRFLFTGNGGAPDLPISAEPASMTLPAVLFYFDYLIAKDQYVDAIRLAKTYSEEAAIKMPLAIRLANTISQFDLSESQRQDLADIQRLPTIPIQSAVLDPKDWFPSSVRRAACKTTPPAIWLELSCWAVSLLEATNGTAGHNGSGAAWSGRLRNLAFPAKSDLVHDMLHLEGYHPINRYAARHQFPVREDGVFEDSMSEPAIFRIQTERARQFLKVSAIQKSGTILFSFHSSMLQGRGMLATVAAARLGVAAMSINLGPSMADRKTVALRSVDLSELPIRMIGRAAANGAEITSEALRHLRQGGLLDIAIDVDNAPGVTSTIPWFLRPISVPSYPTKMAISLQCRVGVSATWVDHSGDLVNDIIEVDLPPNQGDLATRSLWLLQNLGQVCRALAKESEVTIASNTLLSRGGAPRQRNLVPLDEWSSRPGTASTLMAWLADATHGLGQEALKMSAETISFGALQNLTLQMASLLLHYQTEKPEHDLADREIADQHRIMLVLPQGSAFLASALAGLSVGSMVALSQDDIAINQLADRYREFKPDLVIATASAWTRLKESDPDIARQTVLIVEDSGNRAALEKLVFSFSKARKLPKMRSSAPGLVIFTSGSTGKPKGVVHPCDALPLNKKGQGIGADILFGLSSLDKLTYLARWDSVCFLDILSSFRASATVCVPSIETLRSPSALGQWLSKEAVTCFAAPSTIFGMLLRSKSMSCDRQPKLRLTMPWGERISIDVSHQLYQKFPDIAHIASYGASEALWIAFGPLPRSDRRAASMASPGGTLIPCISTTLLDEAGAAVTQGETGNPCVRGPGVMLGYFNDLMVNYTKVTKQTVILQDFARLTDEGSIELLGRSDSIIKIAGRRISLLEIEAAAEMARGAKEAVAFLDARAAQAEVLVAVTREDPDDVDIETAVATSISERCFSSARPARILVMDDFPRLPSGKRDRKAIETLLLHDARMSTAPHDAPTTPTVPNLSPLLYKIAQWAIRRFHLPESGFNPTDQIPPLDSLMVMELLLIVEEVCGTIIPVCALNQRHEASWADLVSEIERAARLS